LRTERGEVTKGVIEFRGDPTLRRDPSEVVRRGIVQVMEGRHVFEHLTVEENLLTGAYTRRDGHAAQRDLDLVYRYFPRLAERRGFAAGYVSGGEQQMVAIGRALMARPTLMLLDEPSMGLAPMLVKEIFDIVARLNREEGLAVLLAEQNATRVSLEAQEGEILSVIGPNGAGKTTVLNMISGFYHPDSGRISLEGRDVTELAPSRIAELGVARTFQNIALFRGMTVLDNLMLGRHVHMKTGVLSAFAYWGLAQKEEVVHRRRVEDIIDFLRIQDLRRRPTGSLAYGLQKRVELGRALALDPKVLLLDEPMGGCNHEE